MRMLIPVFVAFLFGLPAWLPSVEAKDKCRVPEAGRWINHDAAPQQIRRIEIESHCSGSTIVMRMRAFTRCAPRDCKWGWVDAFRTSNGRVDAIFPGLFGAREIQVIAMEERIEALVTYRPHDRSSAAEFHAAIMVRE